MVLHFESRSSFILVSYEWWQCFSVALYMMFWGVVVADVLYAVYL